MEGMVTATPWISIMQLYDGYARLPHKEVYYADYKKQCEDVIIDIITWNLLYCH